MRSGPLPIDHLYGAMGGDVGLRAPQWLPQPKADELANYVESARAKGIAFFYCLNVACLGNPRVHRRRSAMVGGAPRMAR